MIYIILPVYNEEASIASLLLKLKRTMAEHNYNYQLIIVDDCSGDRSGGILREYSTSIPMEIITHRYNRGLGETIRDAFERVAEISKRDDIIIRMDADDTHEAKYIPRMIDKIIKDKFDLVIASRFQKGGGQHGVNLYRAFLSMGANVLMKMVFPLKGVWDYSCGFRAYRAGVIQDALTVFGNDFVELKGLGFTATLEKLAKLRRFGIKIGEVPFELRYDQKLSESKMATKITVLGYLILILKNIYPWRWAKDTRRWLKKIEKIKKREIK